MLNSSILSQDVTILRALAELNDKLEGNVLYDEISRRLYANDASLYQHYPLAVARPKTTADCQKLIQFAALNAIPVIPRGGGTSLAGQVVGAGLVIDCSRYMTRILDINLERKTARVQPGVVLQTLNEELAQHGLMFAPDPSTVDRCDIGGVVGNNAWGAHSPVYGSTRDHVLAMDVVLANGDVMHCHDLSHQQCEKKKKLSSLEGGIYRAVFAELTKNRDEILKHYPPIDQVPCNMGYALHVLINNQPWNPNGSLFSLVPLLCGSEGTLALISEVTVKLVPVPSHKMLVGAHFNALDEALSAVLVAVQHGAAAVELLDHTILSLSENNLAQRNNRIWISGSPQAVLLIEFMGDDAGELQQRGNTLVEELKRHGWGYDYPLLKHTELEQAWAVRRAGLGLLMGMRGRKKPATFIEDSAVPVSRLPVFIKRVMAIMRHYDTQCVYYGSVAMGLVHIRPFLDLKQGDERDKLEKIAKDVADLLYELGGSLSAKHGDGRIRSPFIESLLGGDVYQSLRRIKQVFDPQARLNPGKIVDHIPLEQDLRVREEVSSTHQGKRLFFNWRNEGGLLSASERCHGAGVCRRTSGPGTMCPSYRATEEEQHTTRGRANVFRQLLTERGITAGVADDRIHEVLALCLACKGCRSECPANVDMAKLKAEHLQHYHDLHGVPLRTRFLANLDTLSYFASKMPVLFNRLNRSPLIKKCLNFHPQRELPRLATTSLAEWFATHQQHVNAGEKGDVVLLNDMFTQYYDTKVGIAAIEFLEYVGFRVILSPCFASLRVAISQGLLRSAKQRLDKAVQWLYPHARAGTAIIGLEPSELLTYRDEASDLIEQENGKMLRVAQQAMLFDEFVTRNSDYCSDVPLTWPPTKPIFKVHGHCHQKALVGLEATFTALGLIPGSAVSSIPSGCCGMAGLFGYEAKHYALSQAIGELVLFPTLRRVSDDTIIVAAGTSCRHQIRDGIGREALHPAEVLRQAIPLV